MTPPLYDNQLIHMDCLLFSFSTLNKRRGFKFTLSFRRHNVEANLTDLKLLRFGNVAKLEDSSIFDRLVVEDLVHIYFAVAAGYARSSGGSLFCFIILTLRSFKFLMRLP